MRNCPPEESLEGLLGERLIEPELSRVERHVDECSLCQTTLHRLTLLAGETALPHLVSWLSESARLDSRSDSAAFVGRLKRVESSDGVQPRAPFLSSAHGTPAGPSVDGYDVFEELGRGSVGAVYRARHRGLNRWVALKMILAGPYSTASERQRFRIESQAIARLRHPNIVQVYDVGEQSGSLFLALELVEGRNLATALNGTPRPAREATQLVAVMAEAVQYAHSQGVIHRDLKPANVLLGRARASSHSPLEALDLVQPLTEYELKLTDFGLAKVSPETGNTLTGMTQSGDFLGTPSYTAPEQAQGHANAVGPAADIYSLGAILYELLTGRPPFQGASVLETLLQVAHHEPVPASRLVPKVPRDLDTICLKCLEKHPERRFTTAGELAADLRRFLADEPIRARPVGRIERTARWIRRRPARAVMLVGTSLGILGLLGAMLWIGAQRSATERAVNEDLAEFAMRQKSAQWADARTAIERAKARVGTGGTAELRARLEQGERELELAARLDSIRESRAILDEGHLDMRYSRERANHDYAAAFEAAGFGTLAEDPVVVAARVAASNIRGAIVSALDDWAAFGTEETEVQKRAWLLDVARCADPDPTYWRDCVRDPALWMNLAALTDLTETANAVEPSVQLLVAVGERLAACGGNAVPFLKRVQSAHPDDFWANFGLANALVKTGQDEEALGYFRGALATRPQAIAVYYDLGLLFKELKRWDESIDCYKRVLAADAGDARTHNSLGRTFEAMGDLEAAIDQSEMALALNPDLISAHLDLASRFLSNKQIDDAIVHYRLAHHIDPRHPHVAINLGYALQLERNFDEAIALFELAIRLAPTDALAHSNLGAALLQVGRLEESLTQSENAIRLDPNEERAHVNLGLALSRKGHFEEATQHFRTAMRISPTDPQPIVNLGQLASDQGKHREAIALFEQALALDADFAPAHNSMGAELAKWNQVDEAIEHFRRAVKLEPWVAEYHANLGTALERVGRYVEAEPELRRWTDLLATNDPVRTLAIELLQRCQGAIALERRLPAILAGEEQPVDGTEGLRFSELCRRKQLFAAGYRLASDAFRLDPQLALHPQTFNRYNAACCAALAGCGQALDSETLSDDQRGKLREQARNWLAIELEALSGMLSRPSKADHAFVKNSLSNWKRDPDLAFVREAEHLPRLTPTEREAWRDFWNEVENLDLRARGSK